MSSSIIEQLLTRRSVVARDLKAPGPNHTQLQQILAAAHRVPDHGKIGPWRFIVFQDQAREDFGQSLREIFQRENPDSGEKTLAFEAERFTRAPLVIAVVSSPAEHKVPEWEQVLSAGAACQNMLHAAHGLGFAAQWLTEWYAYSKAVDALLRLANTEKIAGFIYIGSSDAPASERNRPELSERVHYWQKPAHTKA